MRNQFQSVTATFRSEIIIQCNWYTLWSVLVFDLGPLKVSYSYSLVTDMLDIWQSILIQTFFPEKRQTPCLTIVLPMSLLQEDALVVRFMVQL